MHQLKWAQIFANDTSASQDGKRKDQGWSIVRKYLSPF
jgi:hypothetical protein